jgi:predicted nucleic acid-binding protein
MTLFVDSDIVIEVLRGRDFDILQHWANLSDSRSRILYSPVTSAEVWAGAKSSETMQLLELFASLECFTIGEATGKKAGEYLNVFRKSHRLQLADTLIAASAFVSGAALWTRNRKHYPMQDITFFNP